MNPNHHAVLAVISAGILWATSGVIGKVTDAPPLVLTEFRLVGGSAILAALLGINRIVQLLRQTSSPILITAAAGMALFQWSFFEAVKVSGASFATWATVAIAPVWATLIAELFKPTSSQNKTTRQLWFFASIMLGLILMGVACNLSGTGVFLVLLGSASYAAYASAASLISYGHGQSSDSNSSLLVTTFALGGGALLLLPLAWTPTMEGLRGSWNISHLASFAFLVFGSTALAYYLFAMGVSQIGARKALTFQWVQPVATELLISGPPNTDHAPFYFLGMSLVLFSLIVSSTQASPFKQRCRDSQPN